jgi:hypothetical protein
VLEKGSLVKQRAVKALVENFGKPYSEVLGINVSSGKEEEIFRWFLAAILFGAPITEKAVVKTYGSFEKQGVPTPKRILETGWEGLVKILDEGGYARYDYKTADKLLEVTGNIVNKYGGSLCRLYREASDARDLEARLKALGKGVGDVTVSIFLRELRDVWEKADPRPTELVVNGAVKLGILEEGSTEDASGQLKEFWKKNMVSGRSYVNFETALLRIGKDFVRKGRPLPAGLETGA